MTSVVTAKRALANLCRRVIWHIDRDPNWAWPRPGERLQVVIVHADEATTEVNGIINSIRTGADGSPVNRVVVREGAP